MNKTVVYAGGALAGGAVIGFLLKDVILPPRNISPLKLRLLVTQELATYVGTIFTSPIDSDYAAKYSTFFDIDKDGDIDMQDVAWFTQRIGTVVILSP